MKIKKNKILKKLEEIIFELYKGNFDKIYNEQINKEMTKKEFISSFSSYPGKMSLPSMQVYKNLEFIAQEDLKGNIVSYYVDFDLWFNNDISDLTLSLVFFNQDGKLHYKIDNIHTL